jgi:hypothetical protein
MKVSRSLTALVAGLGILVSTFGLTGNASAITGADFQAGRIIDDGVFFDGNAMSAQQIQSFLFTQVPTCDTNGSQVFTGYYNSSTAHFPGAHTYTTADNVKRSQLDSNDPAPYTCLRDYVENPTTHENNIGRPTYVVPGGMSAASIIAASAQAYSISPKVLLTLIQKESIGPLITDDWPWPNEYVHPTGFACPDTAACDSTYNGFYNQVNSSAAQFRKYTNNPTSYNYRIGTNQILYSPVTATCPNPTRATVNIVNQATADLYIYTPYTPNQAALNNLYGTGDGCSAYGNRNFWRIFTDWFGSTFTPPYASKYSAQCAYPAMQAGSSTSCFLSYTNTGYQTWYDDSSAAAAGALPVHLATSHGINRTSAFGSAWGGDQNRPTGTMSAVYEADGTTLAANQHVALPGQIAKFSFSLTAPSNLASGVYQEYFQPIVEGGSTMTDPGTFISITVTDLAASAYSTESSYPTIKPTQVAPVSLSYRNAGNVRWCDDASIVNPPSGCQLIHLSTARPVNRTSTLGSSWGGDQNRPAALFGAVYLADGVTLAPDQHIAQPNQVVKFNFNFTVPANQTPASFQEYFQPIVEGGSQMNDPSTFITATVPLASVVSTGPTSDQQLVAGQTKQLTQTFLNTGNTTWTSGATKLLTNNQATQSFKSSGWSSSTTAAMLNEASVAPGATGSFTYNISAPMAPGNYPLVFIPGDTNGPYAGSSAQYNVVVQTPRFTSEYAGQSPYPQIKQGQGAPTILRYKNTGNVAWYDDASFGSGPSGTRPVHLATSHDINRSSSLGMTWGGDRNRAASVFGKVYESDGTTIAANQDVAQPGQIVEFDFTFSAPFSLGTGTYCEYFQPIVEGVTTMNDPGTFLDVNVLQGNYSSQYSAQSGYPVITRPTSGTATTPAYFMYKNSGNTPWYDATSTPLGSRPTVLATSRPINRSSGLADPSTWCSPVDRNRPTCTFAAVYENDGVTLAANQHVAQPGQVIKFAFNFAATPSTPLGTYREYFSPIIEGGTVMNDPGTFLDVVVK